MAILSITIDDQKAQKVYEAFRNSYGHAVESPTTKEKQEFVRGKVIDYIKDVVFSDEVNTAAKNARAAVVKDEDVAV